MELVSAADIWTHYRSRGLVGKPLRLAIRRHAYVIQANDPRIAAELLARVGRRPNTRPHPEPKRPLRPLTTEPMDPVREAWLKHDRERGLA